MKTVFVNAFKFDDWSKLSSIPNPFDSRPTPSVHEGNNILSIRIGINEALLVSEKLGSFFSPNYGKKAPK